MSFQGNNFAANQPFLLTFVLAWCGWIIALAGVAVASANFGGSLAWAFVWWNVFFTLAILVALLLSIGFGTFAVHRPVLSLYVTLDAALLTFSTSSATAIKGALLAGLIILDIVFYAWIFMISVMEQPVAGSPSGGMFSFASRLGSPSAPRPMSAPADGTGKRASQAVLEQVDSEPVPARALFSYTANPNDPNELSFQKDEVLTVLDRKGKWWRARTADGIVGIVPSNYMEVTQPTESM